MAIVATGALLVSPDSVFIRLLTMGDGTVIFFRGLLSVVGYLLLMARGPGIARRDSWAIGRAGVAVACLTVVGNTCFVLAIRHTVAAHALLILAAAPLFTAILSRVFIGEVAPRRTWIAAAFVAVGIAGIFLARPEAGQVSGDAVALAGSVSLATLFVVVRHARTIMMAPTLTVGAAMTAVAAAPFARPLTLTASDAAIVVAFGAVLLPVSLTLITRGPRYLAAPEVSLLMLIETVLGPVWVWLAVGERPTIQAVGSGLVILGALAGYLTAGLRRMPEPDRGHEL